MAERGWLTKSAPLSASLPDVSSPPYHQHFRASQLSPLPDSPFLSGPTKSPNTNYHIDDDAWADKADPVTGSVFYIEPSISSRTSLVPSSSSSSLSSSPPLSENFIPPPSPMASLPEKESSVQLPPPESPARSLDDFGASFSSHGGGGGSGGSFREKPRSLRKKLRKMMTAGGTKRLGRSLESESMTGLDQFHADTSGLHIDVSLQIPQGSQYGSHGSPLHTHVSSPIIGYRTKVELDLSQFQLGADGGVPCSLEKLGIIPTRSPNRWKFGSLTSLRLKTHYPPPSPSASQPVVVRGVVSGYPAAAATQLKPGDTILSVNQHAVNLDNVDTVLATLSNKIYFLIKKGSSHLSFHSSSSSLLSPPPPPPPHMSSSGGLVRLVAGGKGGMAGLGPQKQHRLFHLLLYVTLDTKEDDPPEKDILFQYPRQLSVDEGGGGGAVSLEQLVRLRGAFLTLSDVLATVTGYPSVSNSSVLLDGRLVHVSCVQLGKELLLIALPSELATQYRLQLFLETVDKAISLMFGSLHDAFTTLSCQSSVDHILGLLFDTVLSQSPQLSSPPATSPLNPSSPLLGVPALPRLKLPTDVNMKLNTVLSGLESCDHSSRPEMLHIRRPYILTGSCLLHRGTLACSHLSSEQQRGVALFCHAYRLLELTASESVSQIVIWKEVFLSPSLTIDQQGHQGHQDHQQSKRIKREFLLAIGLEQTLLCMLMQQVSVPSLPNVAHHPSPSVDAVYVDRGRALLLDLRAQDLLNLDEAETTPLPSLVSADLAVHSLFRRSSRPLVTSLSQHSLAPSKKKMADPFGISSKSNVDNGSDSEEEGVVIGGRANHTRRTQSMLHLKPHFRQRKAHQVVVAKGSSAGGGGESASKKNIAAPRPPYTLTSGHDNLLLHYVDLEAGCGVMVCPTHTTPPGCIQSELLKSFQLACSVVRKVLRRGRGEGEDGTESQSESESDGWDSEEEEEGGKEKAAPQPFIPKASSVVEHGILWECGTRSLKTVAVMQYWVIGRYYVETDRELYICCQENTSQSTVEMAFRLLFGWPG